MSRVVVSLRGDLDVPTLLMIDLNKGSVIGRYTYEIPDMRRAPPNKRGASGMATISDHLFVSAWDRVLVLNRHTLALKDMITHPRFSDLHGLTADSDGVLWAANTNIDEIVRIDGHTVRSAWRTWDAHGLRSPLSWIDDDYREQDKYQSPYHHFHLNDITVTPSHWLITCLGVRHQRTRMESWRKRYTGYIPRQYDGGVFVVQRNTGALERFLPSEGLHDSVRCGTHVYLTEFFGHALRTLDAEHLRIKRTRLNINASIERSGLLCRGVIMINDRLWIGYSVLKGFYNRLTPQIREFRVDGSRTGRVISMESFRTVGIYALHLMDDL
jgi:hypothetical protein